MPNFNGQEYRDNLANDLREVRKDDPGMARGILKEEQRTTRYDLSLKPDQKEAKQIREKAKETREAEESAEIRLSKILSKGGADMSVEKFKDLLQERGVSLDPEKNIYRVFPDGKMKIGNEIVDTNIFSLDFVEKYSSSRTVVITPNDLYIEIVPGHGSNHESYACRVEDVLKYHGKDVHTALMKDGFGLVLENVNLFQENKNPEEELTEEQRMELQEKIDILLKERCEHYEGNTEKEYLTKQDEPYYQKAIYLHPAIGIYDVPRDENGNAVFEKIFDQRSAKKI